MGWCTSCHRTEEADKSCPFYDHFAECIYGGGCWLEEQEEDNEREDLRTGQ